MSTLYTLTPRDQDILSNVDPSSFIAFGPWCKGNGTLPHRAVLRIVGKEYVVHTQIIGEGSCYCEHGTYLPMGGQDDLFCAWRAFEIRVRRHHNFLLHD